MKYEAALRRVLENLNENQKEIFEDLRGDITEEELDEVLSRLQITSPFKRETCRLVDFSEEEYKSFSENWKISLTGPFAVEFFRQLFKNRIGLTTTTKGWLNQMAKWYHPGYYGKAIDLFDKVFVSQGLTVEKTKAYYMNVAKRMHEYQSR